MNATRTWLPLAAILIVPMLAAGCEDDKPAPSAHPSAAATAAATIATAAPKPPSMDAKTFSVDKASSKVDFLMDAPKEKIRGHAPGSLSGDMQVDFMDVTRSTGSLAVDISGLEVFQTKADDAGKFGDEKSDKTQNEHVKNWLEISPDTKEDVRKKNAMTTFTIKSIEVTGDKNVAAMSGPERKVTLRTTGTFELHGVKVDKTVDLLATFKFDGDKPVSVHVTTVKPFVVGLAEHGVMPRDTIGKLLQKGLDALAPKVAKEALVSIDFTAAVKAGK